MTKAELSAWVRAISSTLITRRTILLHKFVLPVDLSEAVDPADLYELPPALTDWLMSTPSGRRSTQVRKDDDVSAWVFEFEQAENAALITLFCMSPRGTA